MQATDTTPTISGPAKGLGVAAIVCGGLGVLIPGLAMIGLLLGIIGLIVAKPGLSKLPVIGTTVSGVAIFLNVFVLILIAFLLPMLAAAMAPASLEQEQQQLSEIGQAFTAYAVDNDARYPAHAEDVLPYLSKGSMVFVLPEDLSYSTELKREDDNPTEPYVYGSFEFMPLGRFALNDASSDHVLAYSAKPTGPGERYRNVLFMDGSVMKMELAEFERVKQAMLDTIAKRKRP